MTTNCHNSFHINQVYVHAPHTRRALINKISFTPHISHYHIARPLELKTKAIRKVREDFTITEKTPRMYYALPHLRLPDFASVLCPNYMSTFLGLTLVYHNVLNFNQDRDCEIFAKLRLKL